MGDDAGAKRREDVEPVVVVGAGPTGLVVATLLAQYGVPLVLLERHSQPYPLPRAVHLDDQVLRILQQVGIAADFAAISRPAAGMRLLDARHRVIAEFRRDQTDGFHGYPQANLFDQPDLERLLRKNLAGYPDLDFRTGIEVTGLDGVPHRPTGEARPKAAPNTAAGPSRSASVLVRYRDVESGADGALRARAVLACDGAGSLVRELIGSTLQDLDFEERWLVVDLRTPAPLKVWDGVEQICDPRRAATCMRIGPDRYRWEFRLHPGETGAELGTPERLRTLLAPWLDAAPAPAPTATARAATAATATVDAESHGSDEPVEPETDPEFEVVRAAEYTFRARLADRWRNGPVFLLGDAAHLTPPFIGQGLGAGLRDAHNLAWKLAFALADDRDHVERSDERLLDTYQAERKPHAASLIRVAIVAGWAMTGGQDRAAAVRRAALALACRVPGLTTLVLDDTSPRLTPGPLVRPLPLLKRLFRPGRELAGSLCPQPWVLVAGGHRRLDDVLGSWFALLVAGPIDAELRALATRFTARLVAVSAQPAELPSHGDQHGDESVGDSEPIRIESPELSRWLAGSRVRAVLIRPDRVVHMSVSRPGRYGGQAGPYPR